MPLFKYKAIIVTGETEENIRDASDEQSLITIFTVRRLYTNKCSTQASSQILFRAEIGRKAKQVIAKRHRHVYRRTGDFTGIGLAFGQILISY